MHRTTRLKVTDINQHFICVICDGYIIDATTIVECLHSFCRTCIVGFLESSKFCPVCDVQVHKTKPLQSIRSDTTLQDVVYKLIPGLYQNEMQRRREFYADHPEAAAKCSTEERGEGAEQRCFYSPKENISLTLEYFKGSETQLQSESTSEEPNKNVMTRHLNCPAAMTVAHLKKFIRVKFSLPSTYTVKIMYAEHLLSDDYTLMDIAYIYSWRRAGPMKFYYTFSHRKHLVQRQIFPAIEATVSSGEPKQESETVSEVIPQASSEAADSHSAHLLGSSDEPEKMETEETVEACNQDIASVTCLPEAETKSVEMPVSSIMDPKKMEVVEPEISTPNANTSLSETPMSTSTVELPTQPSVRVAAPQNTVLPTSNGIKLKLIPCPEPAVKAKSKKSTGRKGGRTRYKSAPVQQRFPRLAPYPPPHQTVAQAACLASPLPHMMRKFNTPVMTTMPPNMMLSFVSTTANSLCNMNKNTTVLPAVQTSLPTVNSPVTKIVEMVNGSEKTVSKVPSPTPIILQTALCDDPIGNGKKSPTDMCSGTTPEGQVKCNGTTVVSEQLPTQNALPRPAFYPLPQQTAPAVCVASPLGQLNMGKSQVPFVVNTISSSLMAALVSTTTVSTATSSLCNVTKSTTLQPTLPATIPNASKIEEMGKEPQKTVVNKVTEPSTPSILQAVLCDDKIGSGKKSPPAKLISGALEGKVECNGMTVSPPTPIKDSAFCDKFSPDKKASKAFEMSVKNSISAEFSDNDDLGCQPDLVVDEQKMDSSDNEEDTDAALRKKITAIAEKEDEADATDDTEADSGRASDISSQARSSCDDDVGSPMNAIPTSEIVTSSASTRFPTFTLAVTSSTSTSSESTNRTVKSNNINHVINNLLRNHERKDSMGALDLSTCTKKPGEGSSRPKAVANPVLDIKHRQQAYLPAPNNKQHTACVPSPKHPTSSPILMHGLTSHHPSLTPHQISAMQSKSPHLPVPPFHATAMVYSSQNRTISSPSIVPGRSTPTYNSSHSLSPPVPSAHQVISPLLSGMIPRIGGPVMSSYPIRSATPTPSAMPARNFGPNHLKGVATSPPQNPNHLKGIASASPPQNPNPLKGTSSSPQNSSTTAAMPVRNFSPASHLKGIASPPQNPYSKLTHKSSQPAIPSYKKSNSTSNQPTIPNFKKSSNSYKSYNYKFKSNSSNLTVINPDPNGYQNKLVIRNLDVRPNNSPQTQKL